MQQLQTFAGRTALRRLPVVFLEQKPAAAPKP